MLTNLNDGKPVNILVTGNSWINIMELVIIQIVILLELMQQETIGQVS